MPTEADARVVQFKGEEFRAAWPVPPMALMEYAAATQAGVDSGSIEGLAAIYDLLESVISPDRLGIDKDGEPTGPTEWERFKRHAKKTRASDRDLLLLIRKVITGQTDRPTSPASDSSDGPESTEQSSEPESSSVADAAEEWLRVKTREESSGRSDRALMVLMAHEARSPV